MQGLIPQAFIDELLTKTDIIELIDSYIPLKKRGSSHLACCPFHQEKTPSFNVVAKQQFYHCFGCNASGNAISFVMNYLQQSFPEAVETLATRAGMAVPREQNPDKIKTTHNLYQLLQRITVFYQRQLKTTGSSAIAYLKQRGVNGEIAHHYQIGYAPPGWHTLAQAFKADKADLIKSGMLIQKEDNSSYDRYRQRLIFPIHDRHGRIIGFGGRALTAEQQPKYLNSPETAIFQKNRELYGLHQVLQHSVKPTQIIVVEGYMDVIALAQHGILNAVATLGTATSPFHIQLLSKHTSQVIFCFDGDNAGRQAAWRALESTLTQLHSNLNARFVFLPDKHDPDSLIRLEGAEQFLARIANAIPFHQFFFDTLTKQHDHTTITGKSQLIQAATPYLNKIVEGPYKQLMIDELARLTHLDEHRLNQLLTQKSSVIDKPSMPKQITRSPIRLATAILLQNPHIYSECCQQIQPDILDAEHHHILQMLMVQIHQNPSINTALLIELWRNSEFFDSLQKLAAWDHQVPENALAKEFIDIVLFLAKQKREHEIQQLLAKARRQSLSPLDRLTLQHLLKQRHDGLLNMDDKSPTKLD